MEIKINKSTYMIGDQITDIQFQKMQILNLHYLKRGNLFSFVKNLKLI